MKAPKEAQAAGELVNVLADVFGSSRSGIRVREVGDRKQFDYSILVAGYRLIAEYKSIGSAGPVSAAIEGLKNAAKNARERGIPVVVVPYMGPVGRRLCDRSAVAWIDLCGNAKIIAPGLRIWIEGRPNKFSDRGRPPNVFAPKSSRVVRQLLLHPQRFQTQAELARETKLGDGYVSKIVRRLRQEQYIVASGAGAVRPRDPDVLLDAWHDAYDFSRQRIIKGHVPARSGDELLRKVVQNIQQEKQEWAVTGLGAAWLFTGYAGFRLATVYVSSLPSRASLGAMGFSDEPRGANLWLALPADEGVFHGSEIHNGVRCVSAVQAYLDLKGQPERAKEAAAELRSQILKWSQHGA